MLVVHHGGKTTHLAELMKNKGKIEAWDLHVNRVKLVEENAKRLGISMITTKQKDALIYEEKYQEKFDKILLDVPCMGLGVLKRKPDIKWKKKQEDMIEIGKVQKEILQVCTRYLKRGGELVYATCSILEEENENMIREFIRMYEPKIQEEMQSGNFVKKSKPNMERSFSIIEEKKILPSKNTDGFYMCKLRKK